jgi:hypothetical protein
MELALGGFGIGGSGAKLFAGSAERVEPNSVFGAELKFEFLAKALGESRAFAVGGNGDLEIAALDDGSVVEVTVVNIVDGVAEDMALVGFEKDGFVEVAERGGGNDEEFFVEVRGSESFGEPIDLAIADAFGEVGMEIRSDDGDVGAGLEKGWNFGCGDGATADDEDAAILEFKEGRKEGHGFTLKNGGLKIDWVVIAGGVCRG